MAETAEEDGGKDGECGGCHYDEDGADAEGNVVFAVGTLAGCYPVAGGTSAVLDAGVKVAGAFVFFFCWFGGGFVAVVVVIFVGVVVGVFVGVFGGEGDENVFSISDTEKVGVVLMAVCIFRGEFFRGIFYCDDSDFFV